MIDILKQIGEGLNHLHQNKMCHRDLDPRNIMFKDGFIKLIDFGLSIKLSTMSQLVQTHIGKFFYAAPEVYDSDENYSGQKADIFSYGCVMYFLSTSSDAFDRAPLRSFSTTGTLPLIKIPSKYPKEYKELMFSCL